MSSSKLRNPHGVHSKRLDIALQNNISLQRGVMKSVTQPNTVGEKLVASCKRIQA